MLRFLCFLLSISLVSAIPSPAILRNSERLARNLPPYPPHRLRRDSNGPTPAFGAERSRVSSIPASYSGRIEIRNEHSRLGYLQNTSPFDGRINLTGDKNSDLHVSFDSLGSLPFDIKAVDPHWNGYPFLGIGTSKPSLVLKPGSSNQLSFESLNQTPLYSPPVDIGNGLKGESRVWKFDSVTKEIKLYWVNPDGAKASPVIAYDSKINQLFFVGDIKKYNQASQNEPTSPVKFFLAT